MPSSACWLALLPCVLAFRVGWAYACAERFVDGTTGNDQANDCTTQAPACKTIQHAVTVACAGDVVSVAAGTYVEQVTIGTSLTLTGAGAAITTIQVPPTPTVPDDIVRIQAGATVELSGFTVSGPLPPPCA